MLDNDNDVILDVSMSPMESVLFAISSDLTRSCLEDLPTSGLVLDYHLSKKRHQIAIFRAYLLTILKALN